MTNGQAGCYQGTGCEKCDWAKNDMEFSGNRSIEQVAAAREFLERMGFKP